MHQLILFIHHQSGQRGKRLKDSVCRHFAHIPLAHCPSMDSFRERLKSPVRYGDVDIYIVFADTLNRLDRLNGLSEHLEDKPLILILPDNHRSTRSNALRLRPRFLTYANSDLEDLIAVIQKMIGSFLPDEKDVSTK